MPRGSQLPSLLALAILAGFVPLLTVVPAFFGVDPSVLSVASVEGYSTTAAYRVALAWSLAGLAVAYILARRGRLDAPAAATVVAVTREEAAWPGAARRWTERLVVAAGVLAALWPPFLAAYNPFVEDKIFLTALHRMDGGLVPYRDFEFLYGPLMLYPAHWWSRLVGYSAFHYYAWLAALELIQWVLVVALLQRLIPRFRDRCLVFLALAALLSNPLLGLNYTGVRLLLPSGALLLLSRDPDSPRVAAAAGALLGLGVAWSHDYSLTALFAAGGLYGVLLLRSFSAARFRAAVTAGLIAAATWLVLSLLLLGGDVRSYVNETLDLVSRFSAGEAGFRFYWTGNSLAAFGLLAMALVGVGSSLGAKGARELLWGDRFMLVAVLATLASLKSGLNRSDVFHVDGAFFLLVTAFLLPLPRSAMDWSRRPGWAPVAAGLVALIAVTNLLGKAPTVAYVFRGWSRGLGDAVARRPAPRPPRLESEAPSIELERARPRDWVLELGAWLAEPGRRGRPVLFYGELWAMPGMTGVYKRDRLNDDFIYDDARGEAVGRWLESNPEALVVMDPAWAERLLGEAGPDSVAPVNPIQPTLVKSLAEWLSSVHFRAVVAERPLTEIRWRRTVGRYVRALYQRERQFGNSVVLTRRSAPAAAP